MYNPQYTRPAPPPPGKLTTLPRPPIVGWGGAPYASRFRRLWRRILLSVGKGHWLTLFCC